MLPNFIGLLNFIDYFIGSSLRLSNF